MKRRLRPRQERVAAAPSKCRWPPRPEFVDRLPPEARALLLDFGGDLELGAPCLAPVHVEPMLDRERGVGGHLLHRYPYCRHHLELMRGLAT